MARYALPLPLTAWSRRGTLLALALGTSSTLGCYGGRSGPGDLNGAADDGGPDADGSGADGSGADAGADSSDPPAADDPSASRLWRLTWAQYDHSIQDLLDDPTLTPSDEFDEELLVNGEFGYSNEARSMRISDRVARQLSAAAETVAQRVVAEAGELLPCTPASVDDAACVETFIAAFGRRAWRRPLSGDERGRLVALYEAGAAESDGALGLELAIEAMLRSPYFLFRFEVGTREDGDSAGRLDDYEIATALSYTLWNRPPDAELRELADAGKLRDPDVREQQLRRMLDDDRMHSAFFTFVPQWLRMTPASAVTKDSGVFPDFTAQTARELELSVRSFLARVLSDDGRLDTLLTASYAYATPASAWIYGDTATPTGEVDARGLERYELDPDQRAGILTQPAFLASHASAVDSSFVHRGLVLAEHLGCFTPPGPPDDVDTEIPPPNDEYRSQRDRFEYATSGGNCKGCHETFTPLGYAFEPYDAVGAFRSTDNGAPVDSTGMAAVFNDLEDPSFDDGVELTAMLASSAVTHRCVTTQLFRYVYGRPETPDDTATLKEAADRFQGSDLDLRELLAALVSSDRFILRTPAQED